MGENSFKKHWRYEYMRPSDMQEAIRTLPLAWLVLSPLEWHGEAMSYGCDPFIGRAICEKAWEKVGGVLLPTLYIGTGTNYTVFEPGKGPVDYWELETVTRERNPGSLFVQPVTMELVLRDYLYFLQREGFKLCVVVSGHGAIDHLKVIEKVCDMFNYAYETGKGSLKVHRRKGGSRRQMPEELRFHGAGGHADFNEASLLGGVDPAMVDISKFAAAARDQKIGLSPDNASKIDFDKGRRVIEFRAEQLADEVMAELKEMGY